MKIYSLRSFLVLWCFLLIAGTVYLSLVGSIDRAPQRDDKRKQDIQLILTALLASLKDDKTNIQNIPLGNCGVVEGLEICRSGAKSCEGLVDLSFLTVKAQYLVGIPTDPVALTENGTGYYVANEKGFIAVCASAAETGTLMFREPF